MNAAIINDINYCKPCQPAQLLKTTTVGAGPTALAAAQTFFRKATVLGLKSLDGGAGAGQNNTGIVILGYDAAAGKQPYVINPGDVITLDAAVGSKQDLSQVYIKVASDNDGVVVIYS